MKNKLNKYKDMRKRKKQKNSISVILILLFSVLLIGAAKVTSWDKWCKEAEIKEYKDSWWHHLTRA